MHHAVFHNSRLGDRKSRDMQNSDSRSRDKVLGLSLDAELPMLFITPDLHAGDSKAHVVGDSDGIVGGDSSFSRGRNKVVVPKKFPFQITTSSLAHQQVDLRYVDPSDSSPPRDFSFLADDFKRHPGSSKKSDLTYTVSSPSSSMKYFRPRGKAPLPPAPPPPTTREKLVSSQLDIHKWQKQRMKQGDDLGRVL